MLLYIKAPLTFDLCQSLTVTDLEFPLEPTASSPSVSCGEQESVLNSSQNQADKLRSKRKPGNQSPVSGGIPTFRTSISGRGSGHCWGAALWDRVLVIGGKFTC